MEASRGDDPNLNPIRNRNPNPNPPPNPLSSIISSAQVWPTIDGPLGLTEEASVDYARRFYKFGFALLPWLWAVNCFYFWPVLRHARAFPQIRNYVVRSAIDSSGRRVSFVSPFLGSLGRIETSSCVRFTDNDGSASDGEMSVVSLAISEVGGT